METKFLRLDRAVEIGDDLDGWRVCWLGGWDNCRVLFVVMVKRITDMPGRKTAEQQFAAVGMATSSAPCRPAVPHGLNIAAKKPLPSANHAPPL
jgi:hypothetical protein